MQPSALDPTYRKFSHKKLRCSLSCLASVTRLPGEKNPDGCNLDLVSIILHFHTDIPVGLEDQKYQQSVTKCQRKNA